MKFLAVAVAALTFGCADSAASDESWQFDHGPYPLLPRGVYDVELEILKDECRPSLEEITSYPLWPPEKVSFRSTIGIPGVVFDMIELRNAWFWMRGISIGDDGHPVFGTIAHFASDEPPYRCPIGPDEEYRLTIIMRILSEGVTETLVTRNWPDIATCLADLGDPWIPPSPCSESYKITHRLAERCPDHCVMPLTYGRTDADG